MYNKANSVLRYLCTPWGPFLLANEADTPVLGPNYSSCLRSWRPVC